MNMHIKPFGLNSCLGSMSDMLPAGNAMSPSNPAALHTTSPTCQESDKRNAGPCRRATRETGKAECVETLQLLCSGHDV